MSLKKPIIKILVKCSVCKGKGITDFINAENATCPKCKGKCYIINMTKKDKNFKKYYIKKLEKEIENWTKLYRKKNNEAQECLKCIKRYSAELDNVINKGR